MGKKGFLIAFLVLLLAGGLIFGGIALFVFKPSEKDTAIDPTAPIADPNIPDGTLMRLAETAVFYDGTYVHRYDYGYNKVFGIDVSSWNSKDGRSINWKQCHDAGIEYVFVRIGLRGYGEEGNMLLDKCYQENLAAAKDAGLLVGCYFYSQAVTQAEAIEEAEFLLDAIDGYTMDLPVVMDCEFALEVDGGGRLYQASLSPAEYATVCAAFCSRIEQAGYTPMIYGNVKMLRDSIDHNILGPERLWVAQYNDLCELSHKDYQFWQFTNSGTVPGIEGDVDINVWYIPETVSLAPQEAASWLSGPSLIS